MALQEWILKEGKREAEGAYVYGHALEEMTRDEAIAVAALGWAAAKKASAMNIASAEDRAEQLLSNQK